MRLSVQTVRGQRLEAASELLKTLAVSDAIRHTEEVRRWVYR